MRCLAQASQSLANNGQENILSSTDGRDSVIPCPHLHTVCSLVSMSRLRLFLSVRRNRDEFVCVGYYGTQVGNVRPTPRRPSHRAAEWRTAGNYARLHTLKKQRQRVRLSIGFFAEGGGVREDCSRRAWAGRGQRRVCYRHDDHIGGASGQRNDSKRAGVGGICVGGFYEAEDARYIRVMVCFDRTNVAPVSGFWSNDKVLIGPDIKCDKTDWGVNLKNVLEPTTFSLVPEKGKLCFHVDDCRLFVLRVKLAKVRGVGNSLFIILSVYSSVTRGALRLTYNDLK